MSKLPTTEAQAIAILHPFDKDIYRHTNEVISLLRRIPGFPGAGELVAAAVNNAFTPGIPLRKLKHSLEQRDQYMTLQFRALRTFVGEITHGDKSTWPGSTGCTALEATIQSVKGTILKRAFQFHSFLLSSDAPDQSLPEGVWDSWALRLDLASALFQFLDKECVPLLHPVCVLLERKRKALGKRRDVPNQQNQSPRKRKSDSSEAHCDARYEQAAYPRKRKHAPHQQDGLTPYDQEQSPRIRQRKTSVSQPSVTAEEVQSSGFSRRHSSPNMSRNTRGSDPETWEPPAPKKDSWEDLLLSIEAVGPDKDDESVLWANVRWKLTDRNGNMHLSKHRVTDLHLAAPQMLLEYYQKFISFTRGPKAPPMVIADEDDERPKVRGSVAVAV